jgi:hypothetical protein
MKKLTKIIKASLRSADENRHLCIDLHRCSCNEVKAMAKLFPKERVARNGANPDGPSWVEYSLIDCDGFKRIELTMFLEHVRRR